MASEMITLSASSADLRTAPTRIAAGCLITDRKLEQIAYSRLHSSGYVVLRHLTCEYHEGVLAVRGRVPTFYLRQVAQTVLRQVPGVEVFVDHIEVGGAVAKTTRHTSHRSKRKSRRRRNAQPIIYGEFAVQSLTDKEPVGVSAERPIRAASEAIALGRPQVESQSRLWTEKPDNVPSGGRVMLIEDDQELSDALTRSLMRWGVPSDAASSCASWSASGCLIPVRRCRGRSGSAGFGCSRTGAAI